MTTLCYLLLRTEYYGLGAHMHSILSDDLMGPSKLIFVCELLYVVTTTTTKLSIGVYFLWLFSKFYQIRIIYPFHRLQTDFYDLRMVYAGY
jgi:hypothetical protein